ncbi:MAG: tetratricopeptide repeat protein [Ignavibacteria bacterium]|nr:tetratricopeptide repeat protein [Ignavibacteria bacterium]
MKVLLYIVLAFVFMSATEGVAQEKRVSDEDRVRQAIKLMDAGDAAIAIGILQDVLTRLPGNGTVLFELAYAYRVNEQLDSAIEILEELVSRDTTEPMWFQALGTNYHFAGDADKAIDTYTEGLKHHPRSHLLYHERGVVYYSEQKWEEAVDDFERAIDLQPMYPPPYLRLAEVFISSKTNNVWGMIYGEIFRNLEPTSKRSVALGDMLYRCYLKNIKQKSNGFSITFCSDASIVQQDSGIGGTVYRKSRFPMPYGVGAYEMPMMLAVLGTRKMDMRSLATIRGRFIEQLDTLKIDSIYGNNVLYDYQRKVHKAGHMEAYSFWAPQSGDAAAFAEWVADNGPAYKEFLSWHEVNTLSLTKGRRFLRKELYE